MALYDDHSVELARKRGAPDPEANAARARKILALIDNRRFNEARARLAEITDPMVRQDLEDFIIFESECRCDPPGGF